VTLKYWNEMSVEEIARVVNESVANVKVKLYRARLMMAQEYASETQTQLRPALQGVASDAS
ncbi:MAG TPA: sigma-70 region 4 domain-containing protein, partial [Anaerolineae bacterium]